jgi:hypothetical protein
LIFTAKISEEGKRRGGSGARGKETSSGKMDWLVPKENRN